MKRLVLKVGSAVLTHQNRLAKDRLSNLVVLISDLKQAGYEVILVTSGSVAAGYSVLKLDKKIIANRQALASIGQPLLMSKYQKNFDKFDIVASQVLLTEWEFDSRKSTFNAQNMIEVLLGHGVVPVINENDTIAVKELTFGDNDQLSAHVAHYFNADMLVILSDIDAYYDKDPRKYDDAVRRDSVSEILEDELNQEVTPNDNFATGGIVTKLKAGKFLLDHGRQMFLSTGMDLSTIRAYLLDHKQIGGTHFIKDA
jgi:glutamate 5-kinase